MASLEDNRQFDPKVFFHGQPCPRCRANLLDRRNFREIPCRPEEKVYLLKCACDGEVTLGLVYGPETEGEYLRRPSSFLVNHTQFHCPTCKKNPKGAAWFTSSGTNGRGYEMLTLHCRFCKKDSSVFVQVKEIHSDPLPPAIDDLDMAPASALAAGPLTADYLLEFDRQYSEEEIWQALLKLPRIKRPGLSLPAHTETRPEKKP